MKFKAAVLVESHKPLEVMEVEWNSKLEWCQVLVKVEHTTICGSQLNEIDAVKGKDMFLPHLLGHEGVGIVQDTGPGVTRLKRGDMVVLHWRKAEGIQSVPGHYWVGDRLIKAGWVTTFNEYAVVSQDRCTRIPVTGHAMEMPLFGCAVTTAAGVVSNDARVKIGDSVLVIGVGGVGTCITQFAHLAGARQVVAIDVSKAKLELAKAFGGIQDTILYDGEMYDLRMYVGGGFDLFDKVIETTGRKEMIEFAWEVTAERKGRCVLVGVPKEKVNIYTLPLHFGKRLVGSEGGGAQPDRDIPRLFDMLLDGRFKLAGMIQKVVKLDDINEGIDYMRSGGVGRVLVNLGA